VLYIFALIFIFLFLEFLAQINLRVTLTAIFWFQLKHMRTLFYKYILLFLSWEVDIYKKETTFAIYQSYKKNKQKELVQGVSIYHIKQKFLKAVEEQRMLVYMGL